MRLSAAAAMIGVVAIAAPAPAPARTRVMMVALCGSGAMVPIPLDEERPERPGSAPCHAIACLTGRGKTHGDGERTRGSPGNDLGQ